MTIILFSTCIQTLGFGEVLCNQFYSNSLKEILENRWAICIQNLNDGEDKLQTALVFYDWLHLENLYLKSACSNINLGSNNQSSICSS